MYQRTQEHFRDTLDDGVRSRSLVVSFHDLTPENYELCAWFMNEMRSIGVNRISLLAVPFWHGRVLACDKNDFSFWLRQSAAEGHDVSLHGFSHLDDNKLPFAPQRMLLSRVYTAKEGEFYTSNAEQILEKLTMGRAVLKVCGVDARGFVAPAWLMNRHCLPVLESMGFEYTTDLTHIIFLKDHSKVFAPTMTYSTRSMLRRACSRIWCRNMINLTSEADIIRIAVHPSDFKHEKITSSIFELIQVAMKDRVSAVYKDFLPQEIHETV